MNATVKFYLRKDRKNKYGEVPVYLIIIANRKNHFISLKTNVNPDHWNQSKNCITKDDPLAFKKNNLLAKNKLKAEKIILDFKLNEKPFSVEEFDRHYKGEVKAKLTVREFIEGEISNHLKATRSKATIKEYYKQLRKLDKFRSNVFFDQINSDFIFKFDAFMISQLGNSKNTSYNSHKNLKAFINMAKIKGLVKVNPYDNNFKIKRIVGDREFLLKDELDMLYEEYTSGNLKQNKRNVLKYFLFSCYTGLRYQDVKNLKHENIKNGFVKVKMEKVKEYVTVPLTKEAIALSGQDEDKKYVFNVLSNQPTNRYLKEVISMAGIDKNISFHCGRHSFATIGISLGIPIEVISRMLGHKDLKTTLVYARIVDDVKVREMAKWG